MRHAAIILASLVLAGCGAATPPPEPITKTVTVNVPVAVHCNPDLGPGPSYTDSNGVVRQGYPDSRMALLAAPSIFDQTKLLLAARAMRIQREGELLAALDGCKG